MAKIGVMMIFTGISMVYQFIVLMLKYYYKEILRLDEISVSSGKLVPELNFGILDLFQEWWRLSWQYIDGESREYLN